MDVSFEPRALVEGGGRLRLNATYYLSKVIIPALARLFSLIGADIWVRPACWPSLMLPPSFASVLLHFC